jgi:hypothetical protein
MHDHTRYTLNNSTCKNAQSSRLDWFSTKHLLVDENRCRANTAHIRQTLPSLVIDRYELLVTGDGLLVIISNQTARAPADEKLVCYSCRAAVERIWHTQDSEGQMLALSFR